MKRMAVGIALTASTMGLLGCTVISRPIMTEAETGVSFSQLVADTDRYRPPYHDPW